MEVRLAAGPAGPLCAAHRAAARALASAPTPAPACAISRLGAPPTRALPGPPRPSAGASALRPGVYARRQSLRPLAALPAGQEVEVKLRLLDSAAYEAVAAALAPTWRQDHEQENYFFDGTQGELNSQRAVLRCRFYGVDKKAVLTLKGKMKIVDGVGRATEVEEDVDPVAARAFLDDPALLAKLDSALMADCRSTFGFEGLKCLGGFRNLRREYAWEDHVLELDKTQFEHGTVYEIEVETTEPEQLRDKLEPFLAEKGIAFAQSTTSKFANFIKKTLEPFIPHRHTAHATGTGNAARDVPARHMRPHYSAEMLAFCRQLPKVELHAHLNGSIRPATIRELAQANVSAVKPGEEDVVRLTEPGANRSLKETFALFDLIHQVTTDHASITRITREVLEDMAADGVVYAELRTTPKENLAAGMSKRSYMAAVFEGAQQYVGATGEGVSPAERVEVRWLLSINRRDDARQAMETVELAASLAREGAPVVGVDLSGNPTVGEWATWRPALEAARSQGLAVALHAAEVWNPTETAAMIDFLPGRVGHMCCLDEALEASLLQARIPLELCLTSNVRTGSVPSYDAHHFAQFRAAGHPVILCTDDFGVFSTSLSEEYAIASAAFGLSRAELAALARCALEHTFCTDISVRSRMKEAFATAESALASSVRSQM